MPERPFRVYPGERDDLRALAAIGHVNIRGRRAAAQDRVCFLQLTRVAFRSISG